MAACPTSQPRRWCQFKLSTWFVLVAILAWAMIYWPWIIQKQTLLTWPVNRQLVTQRAAAHAALGEFGPDLQNMVIFNERYSPSGDLLHPALALAAFVSWKGVWAVVECRGK